MKKVITYGTFDLFHYGHYSILERAKAYGDYLIVGVTAENYDTERGKLSVQDSLSKRIENVKNTGFADQIIVEEYVGQKISDILKYDIDVLVIGSDWRGKFDHLSKYCEVKYLERTKDISSTEIRQQKFTMFKFGIATDNLFDNGSVLEPKNVSGIHVESTFSHKMGIAEEFARKYELDKGYTDYDQFLNSVDIVYCKSALNDRKQLIEKAIYEGKHVIYDAPLSLDYSEVQRLSALSKVKGVFLLANIPMIYLQSFGQLVWMIKGNVIGEVLGIKCSLSKRSFGQSEDKPLLDIAYYSLSIMIKLMDIHVEKTDCKIVRNDKGNIQYCTLYLDYKNAVSFIEIGMNIVIEDGMIILGTDGMIFIPEKWWELGYFKLKKNEENKFKRYSFNFEGNGFRYIIRTLLQMIRMEVTSIQEISDEESKEILEILKVIKMNELSMG
jgi:choline-phosphate cytidylyltransferase